MRWTAYQCCIIRSFNKISDEKLIEDLQNLESPVTPEVMSQEVRRALDDGKITPETYDKVRNTLFPQEAPPQDPGDEDNVAKV